MKNKNFNKIAVLMVGSISAYGCDIGTSHWINNNLENNCDKKVSEVIQEDLDMRIREADFDYLASGGHEIGGYVSLLDEHKGECFELLYICDNVRGRDFCYRRASVDNPELRTEICEEYSEYLYEFYDENNIESSIRECREGIPTFIY